MISRSRAGVVAAVVFFVLAVCGCGQSSDSAGPTLASAPVEAAMPSPSEAKSIVRGLWAGRETDLMTSNVEGLSDFEMQSLRAQDTAYINAVQCGCEPQKDAHTLIKVIPQIPRVSSLPEFLAQVRTTNTNDGQHPWYVVAVGRTSSGFWKLAFLTFGGYQRVPPLQKLTKSTSHTPSVSSTGYLRMATLAKLSVTYAKAHNKLVSQTSYGATVHRRPQVDLTSDGIFGLTLPSGKLLSCFTMHTLDTYTMKRGLAQNEMRQQWGAQLAPGAYRSVTIDRATPQCDIGTSIGKSPGSLWLQYDQQTVATTGVPMSAAA